MVYTQPYFRPHVAKTPWDFYTKPQAERLPGRCEGCPGTASSARCSRLPPASLQCPPSSGSPPAAEISSSMNNEWKMQPEPKAAAGRWAQLVLAPSAAAGGC